MFSFAMIDLIPLLTLFGTFSLVVIALVVGFWPVLESPLIALLEDVRDWRALRKRRRDLARARRTR